MQITEPEVSEDDLIAGIAAPGRLIAAFRETARRVSGDYAVLHAATGLIQGRRREYPMVSDAIRTRLVEHPASTPLSSSRLG